MAELYEFSMQPEHINSTADDKIYDSTITSTGAMSVSSGEKTGRTPKDKRILMDETTKDVSFIMQTKDY